MPGQLMRPSTLRCSGKLEEWYCQVVRYLTVLVEVEGVSSGESTSLLYLCR
jgi:hypothetical protein